MNHAPREAIKKPRLPQQRHREQPLQSEELARTLPAPDLYKALHGLLQQALVARAAAAALAAVARLLLAGPPGAPQPVIQQHHLRTQARTSEGARFQLS